MELLLYKTEEQLIQEGIGRLDKTDLAREGSSGKVVRLILNIVNSILGESYQALRVNHLNAFLSTAEGDAIDSIGVLLNCYRLGGESDNDFKYRISQAILSTATANETAIRLAALSVESVQAVVMKEFTYGTGSYSVYVITDQAVTSSSVIEEVRARISAVKAFGIKFEILSPVIKDVQIGIMLSFSPLATESDKSLISMDVRSAVVNYINSKNMGEPIVIRDIVTLILSMNNLIRDAYISSMRIDDNLVFITDQECRWNHRFLASSKEGAITIQGVM